MADAKIDTSPQTNQEQISVEELSKKIKDTTNELNQLKNGLTVYNVEEQDRRLSEIEESILDCTQDLQHLESETLSNTEKNELKKLKSQIDGLKTSKEQLRQQIERQTRAEIETLNQSITQQQAKETTNQNGQNTGGETESQPESPSETEETEKKEKRKKILRIVGGVGIGAGILALGRRIFGGKIDYESEIPGYSNMNRKQKREARKKLRKEKREARREERREGRGDGTFRQRPMGRFLKGTAIFAAVGSGVYYVAHGIYTKNWGIKDLFDWEKGKKLTFDQAMDYCKGALANQDNKDGMAYGMDLKYHEDTGEIEAYGERVKIDKDKRKIDDLGIEFKKYESLINTAILIAYLKKNCSYKCANNAPFNYTGSWSGNIDVNTGNGGETAVDGTGNGGRIVGITTAGLAGIATGIFGGPQAGIAVGALTGVVGYGAGYAFDKNNLLHDYMPEVDSENGMKILAGYLNKMECWQARNQTKEDVTESPIKDEVREVIEKIQKENPELPAEGGRAQINAVQDPNDKEKYTITAYGREITAKITGEAQNRKMKMLDISGGIPAIKTDMTKGNISQMEVPLKEGLYMSAILGKFLENYHHKGVGYPYFDLTWKYVKSRADVIAWKRLNGEPLEKALENGGLYFNDTERTLNPFNTDFWKVDTLVYSNKKLQQNMPTIFKNKGKQFLEFLNDGITDECNVSIWKKP